MHCSVSEFLLELHLAYPAISRMTCLMSYVETLQALAKHMCQRNDDNAKINCRVLMAQKKMTLAHLQYRVGVQMQLTPSTQHTYLAQKTP